jgi:hypothetical protein
VLSALPLMPLKDPPPLLGDRALAQREEFFER